MKKRLSILLAIVMLLGILSPAVFAAADFGPVSDIDVIPFANEAQRPPDMFAQEARAAQAMSGAVQIAPAFI